MSRVEKKCLLFSACLHGLLLVILIGSSAFRDKPEHKDIPLLLTMVNLPVTDQQGAGGGSPQPAAQPTPAQPVPAPPQPVAAPVPAPVPPPPKPVVQEQHVEPVVPVEPKPRRIEKETEPEPAPKNELAVKPERKHKEHKEHKEIVPTFASTAPVVRQKPVKTAETDAAQEAEAAAAENRRARSQISRALDRLAAGVRNSGAQGTVVDMPGQGGGEAFVGYETYIYNAYHRAWVTPDSVANKLAVTDVKIVVARDGSILSAEIATKSGSSTLDQSVEKALRAVRRLPPFPAASHDEQRSFLIRFDLESQESSG